MSVELYYLIHNLMASAAFGYCRLAPIFYLLPFLSSGNVSAVVRIPVMTLVAMAITPTMNIDFNQLSNYYMVFIVFREVLVGLILGCTMSLPFWVFHAIGSFIDNQRGATLSSTLDPSTGIDSSELAKFMNMFAVIVYLQNGGMLIMLETIRYSYEICPPLSNANPEIYPLFGFLSRLMVQCVLLSSPVIAVLLASEAILGLLSRYASQLNAFSISLTLKSGLAFFILILYFYPVLTEKVVTLTPPVNLLEQYFIKR